MIRLKSVIKIYTSIQELSEYKTNCCKSHHATECNNFSEHSRYIGNNEHRTLSSPRQRSFWCMVELQRSLFHVSIHFVLSLKPSLLSSDALFTTFFFRMIQLCELISSSWSFMRSLKSGARKKPWRVGNSELGNDCTHSCSRFPLLLFSLVFCSGSFSKIDVFGMAVVERGYDELEATKTVLSWQVHLTSITSQ